MKKFLDSESGRDKSVTSRLIDNSSLNSRSSSLQTLNYSGVNGASKAVSRPPSALTESTSHLRSPAMERFEENGKKRKRLKNVRKQWSLFSNSTDAKNEKMEEATVKNERESDVGQKRLCSLMCCSFGYISLMWKVGWIG